MINPFSDLGERSVKPSRLVVGLMSGTSADSIDVAVCRIEGQGAAVTVKLIHSSEHAHDPDVQSQIASVADLDVRAIAELHVRLGEAFAEAGLRSLAEASVSPDEVDVIGSHGQTVYHHSGVIGARARVFNLAMATSSPCVLGSTSFPTSARAILRPAARVRRFPRSRTSSCLPDRRLAPHAGERS